MGGSNLPEGQELVGMFAYRLVSGHWRVQIYIYRRGADWGGGDGDHGCGPWAQCDHGMAAAEGGVGGRGMACHARPCGSREAAEGGG